MVSFTTLCFVESQGETFLDHSHQPLYISVWHFAKPKGPLSVLKESWAGERELPFSIGKKPEEYLQTLKENLELAKVYAEYYSEIEQKRYADHYNLRSTDRKFQLGDKVIMLAPDLGGAKL